MQYFLRKLFQSSLIPCMLHLYTLGRNYIYSYKLSETVCIIIHIQLHTVLTTAFFCNPIYRVVHKSRITKLCSTIAGMVTMGGSMSIEGETLQSVCPTLQALDMSTTVDTADINPVFNFLPHTLHHLMVDSGDCYCGKSCAIHNP
jgi:hypothetical protein